LCALVVLSLKRGTCSSGLITLRLYQARREGESFPGPRDAWGGAPSLKNTAKGVPDGLLFNLI